MAIGHVSLMAVPHGNVLTGYQLKIGTKMDDSCRTCLMPLLKGKNLEMEESEDKLVVFSPH
jgi:hypothetical protein